MDTADDDTDEDATDDDDDDDTDDDDTEEEDATDTDDDTDNDNTDDDNFYLLLIIGSFQPSSRQTSEWYTEPTERQRINPFILLDVVIPSRIALGFDKELSADTILSLDLERV